MHHRIILRLALLLLPFLLLVGAVLLWLLLQSQKELEQAQQTRFEYFENVTQIRMLSGQLSTRVRNYVYTGSERDLSHYYHVLAITEGHHSRSNGSRISNEQLINTMVLNREEFNLLERARLATLTLSRLEEEALRLMETGHHIQARQKVFNADYDIYSEMVSGSVNQFISLLLERLDRSIEGEQQRHHNAMMSLMIIFLLLILCCLVLGWQLSHGIINGKPANQAVYLPESGSLPKS